MIYIMTLFCFNWIRHFEFQSKLIHHNSLKNHHGIQVLTNRTVFTVIDTLKQLLPYRINQTRGIRFSPVDTSSYLSMINEKINLSLHFVSSISHRSVWKIISEKFFSCQMFVIIHICLIFLFLFLSMSSHGM